MLTVNQIKMCSVVSLVYKTFVAHFEESVEYTHIGRINRNIGTWLIIQSANRAIRGASPVWFRSLQ